MNYLIDTILFYILATLAILSMLSLFLLAIIMCIPSFDRAFNMGIFKTWNPEGYRKIKEKEDHINNASN
jgi:hypothetical protein